MGIRGVIVATAAAIGLAVGLSASPSAAADPQEVPPVDPQGRFLFRVHQYSSMHPEVAGKSDGELLSAGYSACKARNTGQSAQAAGISPYIFAMATSYLCAASPTPGGHWM